jgi:hypothetical protein
MAVIKVMLGGATRSRQPVSRFQRKFSGYAESSLLTSAARQIKDPRHSVGDTSSSMAFTGRRRMCQVSSKPLGYALFCLSFHLFFKHNLLRIIGGNNPLALTDPQVTRSSSTTSLPAEQFPTLYSIV